METSFVLVALVLLVAFFILWVRQEEQAKQIKELRDQINGKPPMATKIDIEEGPAT